MRSRLLWRRSATALGTYGGTLLGILGTIVAARVLGTTRFGRFAEVLATTSFFQLLLDLTSEEALVKFGFRYSVREDWGRFRRLLVLTAGFKTSSALVSGLIVAGLAPFADRIFGTHGLFWPLLVGAPLPLLQSTEGLAASALTLRQRYDVRGAFLTLSMALRLAGLAIGAPHGLLAAVGGVVVAQALTTAAIGGVGLAALGRFPRAASAPLGDDRPAITRFVVQSSIGSGILSLRGWMAPLLLGLARDPVQVGLFRVAQAPQQGLGALSSPVRLILLTEQTREWERGRTEAVLEGLRRYVLGTAALSVLAVGPLLWLMPKLIRLFFGSDYAGATNPARLVLLAALVQLVFGWTKSFPVSIGRPDLRIVAHGIETVALLPALFLLGRKWGATGAAGAVLFSVVVFAVVWTVLLARLRRGTGLPRRAAAGPEAGEAALP